MIVLFQVKDNMMIDASLKLPRYDLGSSLVITLCNLIHKDFIEASQQNSHQGNNIPEVVFIFFDGITKNVSGESSYVPCSVVCNNIFNR